MGLKLGGARADNLIIRSRMFVVGEGENRGQVMGEMVDHQLAAQLAV